MASNYYSRSGRKRPTPTASRCANAAEVAAILGGKTQAGGYMCRCPGPLHRNRDRNPSLSVKDGRNGRPLFHCFAGCAYVEIVTALRAKGLPS
jgi:putative DNA primase/helicase